MGRTAATQDNTITKRPKYPGKKTLSLSMQEFLDLMLNKIVKINVVDKEWAPILYLTRKDVLDRCIIEPKIDHTALQPYAIYVVDYSEIA